MEFKNDDKKTPGKMHLIRNFFLHALLTYAPAHLQLKLINEIYTPITKFGPDCVYDFVGYVKIE